MAQRIALTVKHGGLGSAEEWALFCVLVKGVSRHGEDPRIYVLLYRTL
jgi:hypothetical protein